MKHTNYKDIRKKNLAFYTKELTAALQAHKGAYTFMNDKDGMLGPIIKNDTCISSIRLDNDGKIRVFVARESVPVEKRIETEFNYENLDLTTIDYLLSMIPETVEVKDVTTTPCEDIDPEILLELTAATYHVLYPLGIKGVELSSELRTRAAALTQKYADTNWEEKDFWLTMDDESDQFLKDMISLYCGAEIEIRND